jgi:site-specific recombinase XerC
MLQRLMCAAAQTPHVAHDYAIVQLMVHWGTHQQVFALWLGNVQISEQQGWPTIRTCKGNESRKVPLNASVCQALTDRESRHVIDTTVLN